MFSFDMNQPGSVITCIGYTNYSGIIFQQNTVWKVTYSSGLQTDIASSSVFALSNEPLSVGGFGQTNLTILNVTNNLDGSTITCGIMISGSFRQIATFTVKIYSKCVQPERRDAILNVRIVNNI